MKKKFGLAGLVVLMVMLALGAAAEEGNTIIIGCDMYAPYTYKNGTGEFVGVDVDFATEAFGRLGYAVQFREIVWENKQSYLDSGEIDCLWSCFTMSGREDEYTWAGPYLYSRQVAMVRADSDYTELSQLAGKRAAVQASTTAEKALLRRENPNVPEMKQVLCFSTLGEAAAARRTNMPSAAWWILCRISIGRFRRRCTPTSWASLLKRARTRRWLRGCKRPSTL